MPGSKMATQNNKFFFLETQILFPSLNLNHITHSPWPWASHLPWKQSMCYLFFSLLGFFLSLKVLMEWETPVGVLGEGTLCLQAGWCVGCTACLTEGQLPLRNFQPLCEMTTDKDILLTSRLPVVPAALPSSEIWEPT